ALVGRLADGDEPFERAVAAERSQRELAVVGAEQERLGLVADGVAQRRAVERSRRGLVAVGVRNRADHEIAVLAREPERAALAAEDPRGRAHGLGADRVR